MTKYIVGSSVDDIWGKAHNNGPLTTNIPFLDVFSDDVRYPFNLPKPLAIDQSLFNLMKSAPYEFDNVKEVLEYVHKNESIYLVLIDALTASADIFPGSKRKLMLHHDMEIDDEYLVIQIGMESYPETLFEKMDELTPRYLKNMDKVVSGWVTVVPKIIQI